MGCFQHLGPRVLMFFFKKRDLVNSDVVFFFGVGWRANLGFLGTPRVVFGVSYSVFVGSVFLMFSNT